MKFIKSLFSKQNIFFTLVFLLSLAITVTNRAIQGFSGFNWLADFAGMFSVIFCINNCKHNIYMFIFNILATVCLGVVNIFNRVYFSAFICLFVSLPLLISGLVRWIKNEKNNKEANLNNASKKELTILIIVFFALTAVSMVILYFLNSNLFYLDAITTSLSIIGVYMCSKTYVQQFYFFIVSNVISIALYIMLSIQNINNLPILWSNVIFLLFNTISLFSWIKLKRQQDAKLITESEVSQENK